MADLKKTQVEWKDLFRAWMQYLRPLRILVDLRRRFQEARIRAFEQFDDQTFLSNWNLTGVERGINSTEDGQLFVKLDDETPGAAQAQVGLYKDSALGAPDLVAEGDAADNGTITLVEQNNSGVSGTVDIGVVTASLTNIILFIDIDEGVKAISVFGTDTVGLSVRQKFLTQLSTTVSSLTTIISTLKTDIENNFVRTRISGFLSSTTSSIIGGAEAADVNGDIQVTFSGLLEELSDAMGDETVAPTQFIKPNVVTTQTPEFDPDNVGLGAFSVLSTRQNASTGRVIFKCSAGKATTLSETFTVTMKLDNGITLLAGVALTIKLEWESVTLGVRGKLTRTITTTGVSSVTLGAIIVNGETLTNTDVGDIFTEVTSPDAGATINVEWFSNAAKTNKVATGTRAGVGVVTMNEFGGSGLSGSVDVTSYTADDLDIVIKLNPFALDEEFHFDMANDEAGLIQTLIKTVWNFSLPSSGSPTLVDALLAEVPDLLKAES